MQVSVSRARARVSAAAALVAMLALGLASCRASLAPRADAPAVYAATSISDAGSRTWETPPSARDLAYEAGTIRASNAPTVVPVRYETTRARTYTTTEPAAFTYDVPPPPPPPTVTGGDLRMNAAAAPAGATAPAPTYVGPGTSIAAPCAPTPALPAASPTACRLPCEDGISMWHLRGLGGFVTFSGDDPAEDCSYAGADIGRTFCGCWGLDVFYRWNSGQFDRQTPTGLSGDGGDWHHIGVKLTYESRFGNSRFFWWAGLGPEYFTTSNYVDDDSGFGIYAEAGIGYLLTKNLRIRAGVAIHGVDTDVTRENPVDDGKSRWLWIIGPHIGGEFDF